MNIHNTGVKTKLPVWGPVRASGLAPVLAACLLAAACSPGEERIPRPPAPPPLSRTALGYGVVSAPYTRVMSEPGADGVSLGYVREHAILKITERRLAGGDETGEYWVLTEGAYTGWLPESAVRIYDTEEKAGTAAGAASGNAAD